MRLYATGHAVNVAAPLIGKLTTAPIPEHDRRKDFVILAQTPNASAFGNDVDGYLGVLSVGDLEDSYFALLPHVTRCSNLGYLSDGDVVLMLPRGTVNVLYRRASPHNTILATEQCNSLCLMCTQPPKEEDDSHRVGEILRLLELIDPECRELGISGGEPTLLGQHLLAIVEKARVCLPNTALHILTNGRLFKNRAFAADLGRIGHPDLMLGIPLYSDIDEQHDYVVQARGAFDETVLGLYNLAASNVRIEIRVVIHALTYKRLPQLAEFLSRNFPFASHVALMGMEMFGYVHLNLGLLWIDPVNYQEELEKATMRLAMGGTSVSIYNHQLCTVPPVLWPFTRRSISDWKNVYADVCSACGVRDLCGGFFQSATRKHSAGIHSLERPDERTMRQLHGYILGENVACSYS